MLIVLLAVVGMAVKDGLGTFLVVAEARGRATLAGALDAAGDLVNYGLGALITLAFLHQGRSSGLILLVAAATTSFFTTRWATTLSARYLPDG